MKSTLNNKDKIIQASIKLITQKTFAGVNLQDIVTESGVSVGSIYNFFPKGKNDIALYIDGQYVEIFNNQFIGLLKSDIVNTDLQKLVEDMLVVYLKICDQFPCYFDNSFVAYVCNQNSEDGFNDNLAGYLTNVIRIKNSKISTQEAKLKSKLIIKVWDTFLEEYYTTKDKAILNQLKIITNQYLQN